MTADDYGMAPCVNQAIEELAAAGQIQAVAVMVHDDAVLDTLDRLRATGVALGLHVVFTQEAPVLPELRGTAVAPDGRLLDSPYQLMRALVRRPGLARLLAAEIEEQARRYAALGLPLDFVNSHEHSHEVPPLWRLVARLIERHQPKALRSAHVQPITVSKQGALALLSRLSWGLRPVRAPLEILSPLGAGQAGAMSLEVVDGLIERGFAWHRGDDALSELVVHPAVDDAPLRARYGARTGDRRAEYELLASTALRELWRRRDADLVAPGIGYSATTTR